MARGSDGADVGGKAGSDLGGAVAGDEGDFADGAGGIDEVKEFNQFRGRQGGTDFDADGVGDASDVFDVGVLELAGAVADPEEVGGGVVVRFGGGGGGGRGGGVGE